MYGIARKRDQQEQKQHLSQRLAIGQTKLKLNWSDLVDAYANLSSVSGDEQLRAEHLRKATQRSLQSNMQDVPPDFMTTSQMSRAGVVAASDLRHTRRGEGGHGVRFTRGNDVSRHPFHSLFK